MKRINRETRLFFDASVLVAGAISSSGGSALVLEACRVGGFTALVSQALLLETERNLLEDFPQEVLERFHTLVIEVPWVLVPLPSSQRIRSYYQLINEEDAHVLGAAIAGGSHFLLTLDRRHFMTSALKAANLPLIILTPGDFIRKYYPLHEEYPSLSQAR